MIKRNLWLNKIEDGWKKRPLVALNRFREYYPEDLNYCYSPHISKPYKLKSGNHEVIFQSYPE